MREQSCNNGGSVSPGAGASFTPNVVPFINGASVWAEDSAFSYQNSNLGIGVSSPTAKLDVNTASNSIGIAFRVSSLSNELFTINNDESIFLYSSFRLGRGANNNPTSTAYGDNSLNINWGGSNTAIGYNVMPNNSGSWNVGLGTNILTGNNSGSSNFALGVDVMLANTSGSNNVAMGNLALRANTSGGNNVAIGFQTLFDHQTGSNNIGVGTATMNVLKTGSNNTGIGGYAYFRGNGSHNVAIGFYALESQNNAVGNHNTVVGALSGRNISTGQKNIVLGSETGLGITTGSNNVIVGGNISGLSGTLTSTMIFATGGGAERFRVNSLGDFGISTNNPLAKLHVRGASDTTDKALQINSLNNELFVVHNNGNSFFSGNVMLGIPGDTPSSKIDINDPTGYNSLRLRTTYTPTDTIDVNGQSGQISIDDDYIYVKTSAGWKRTALTTF